MTSLRQLASLLLLFLPLHLGVHAQSRDTRTRSAVVAAKAYSWLMQNQAPAHFTYDVVWIYDFLMRKFHIAEPRAVRIFRRDVLDGRYWKAPFAPILHILVPAVSYRPDTPTSSRNPIDRLVFQAIWCDQIPVQKDYLQQVAEMAKAGGYELTHMYLAMVILREQGCLRGDALETQRSELEDRLAHQLEQLCLKSRVISDLQIEAAAFLAHGRPEKPLPQHFLNRVLTEAENHFDNPFVSRMSGHTAVLLLWYLLENAVQASPRVPIAPRPR